MQILVWYLSKFTFSLLREWPLVLRSSELIFCIKPIPFITLCSKEKCKTNKVRIVGIWCLSVAYIFTLLYLPTSLKEVFPRNLHDLQKVLVFSLHTPVYAALHVLHCKPCLLRRRGKTNSLKTLSAVLHIKQLSPRKVSWNTIQQTWKKTQKIN